MLRLRLIQGFVAFAVLSVTSMHVSGNIVLNGSFEDNQESTSRLFGFNQSFTDSINNLTAFGNFSLGISESGGFFDDAFDGDWFIIVSGDNASAASAFSLELAAPLVTGQVYQLSLQSKGAGADASGYDVGISSAAGAFGSVVFTGQAVPNSINAWTGESTTFTATSAATYLTIRSHSGSSPTLGTSLDAISVVAVPEPNPFALLIGLTAFATRRHRRP